MIALCLPSLPPSLEDDHNSYAQHSSFSGTSVAAEKIAGKYSVSYIGKFNG